MTPYLGEGPSQSLLCNLHLWSFCLCIFLVFLYFDRWLLLRIVGISSLDCQCLSENLGKDVTSHIYTSLNLVTGGSDSLRRSWKMKGRVSLLWAGPKSKFRSNICSRRATQITFDFVILRHTVIHIRSQYFPNAMQLKVDSSQNE